MSTRRRFLGTGLVGLASIKLVPRLAAAPAPSRQPDSVGGYLEEVNDQGPVVRGVNATNERVQVRLTPAADVFRGGERAGIREFPRGEPITAQGVFDTASGVLLASAVSDAAPIFDAAAPLPDSTR